MAEDQEPDGAESEPPSAERGAEEASSSTELAEVDPFYGSDPYEDSGWKQLSALLDKVPFVGALKKEAARLRKLVGERRAPRVAIVGPDGDAATLACALLAAREVETTSGPSGWREVRTEGRRLLWHLGLATDADVVLYLASGETLDEPAAAKEGDPKPFVVLVGGEHPNLGLMRQRLESSLENALPVFVACRSGEGFAEMVPQDGGDRGLLALREAVAAALPEEAAVEGARALDAPAARLRVADAVVQSCSTLAITVALAPVPLSDIALLAPVQGLMVSTVCHISGRTWNRRTAAEWVASAGVVGGMGVGFRAVARQVVKLVPGAGSVVAGSIAGAGTLALGRSAKRYFLLEDSRRHTARLDP
ncbi:MAG: hypothetical protein AAF645_16870 [Myxococcota bacterium]